LSSRRSKTWVKQKQKKNKVINTIKNNHTPRKTGNDSRKTKQISGKKQDHYKQTNANSTKTSLLSTPLLFMPPFNPRKRQADPQPYTEEIQVKPVPPFTANCRLV